MAFGYYWYVIIIYLLSEPAAYHLSGLIEAHAFNTYDGFLKDHGDLLKSKPVPEVARKVRRARINLFQVHGVLYVAIRQCIESMSFSRFLFIPFFLLFVPSVLRGRQSFSLRPFLYR